MGAKFVFIGEEATEVVTKTGKFVAEPGHVYDLRGREVYEVRERDDFRRVGPSTEGEAPTWESRS